MIGKYSYHDRFDSIVFKDKRFMHPDSYISKYSDNFHIESGRCWVENDDGSDSHSCSFGINKREWRVSGHGISVSSFYVGQNE